MDTTMNIAFSETQGGCGCAGGQQGGAKRKLTPYNKFVKSEFKKLRQEYPAKSAPEIMKLVAKKWKASHPSVAKSAAKKGAKKSKK